MLGSRLVYVMLATGYNILLGMCGQLAMSHVAFFGIGAYASALLTRDAGVPFRWPWAGAPAGDGGRLCAWVMARGGGAVRRSVSRDDHLRVPPMAFTVFINWTDVTNGWGGLSRIPPIRLGGFACRTHPRSYYLLAAVAALGLFVAGRTG